jgi:hypothetical protein
MFLNQNQIMENVQNMHHLMFLYGECDTIEDTI